MFRKNLKKRKVEKVDSDPLEELQSLLKDPVIDSDKNHIYFYTDVTQESCLDLNRKINDLNKELLKHAIEYDCPPPSIYLHINSTGGDLLSSFGTYYLAYIMATKNFVQDIYLSSVYYYLHFQYNGWFFFACMGLFFGFLNLKKTDHPFFGTTFKLFAIACFPVYFLSLLWLHLPLWLSVITITGASIQVFAWFEFLYILIKSKKIDLLNLTSLLNKILLFICFGLSIKLLLQLASTVPYLSQLAFGFRPIVIAYLHLVLLAVISLFLIFYTKANRLFYSTKKLKFGIFIFLIGVILNETVLAIQGITSLHYTTIPYINNFLFAVALLLFVGIVITTYFSLIKDKKNPTL